MCVGVTADATLLTSRRRIHSFRSLKPPSSSEGDCHPSSHLHELFLMYFYFIFCYAWQCFQFFAPTSLGFPPISVAIKQS